MAPTLDSFDRKILDVVQRDNRLTSDAIGEKVGLSATAVQRRLKRLRESRVIEADVSIVSPKAVGQALQMILMVSLERERADIIDRFKRSIRTAPEVMNGYFVTGEADFVLVVTTKNMEDYESFTQRFFYGNSDIKSVKTMVVMDRVKVGFALPLEAAGADDDN
jgi:Lrp/AsnC family leucine-responsive transcriptional regulator